uniref:Putative secreted protein n=1 Tax=Ixodes ricinus TaxID=34613 RepID=A0A6B0USF6_IXORI
MSCWRVIRGAAGTVGGASSALFGLTRVSAGFTGDAGRSLLAVSSNVVRGERVHVHQLGVEAVQQGAESHAVAPRGRQVGHLQATVASSHPLAPGEQVFRGLLFRVGGPPGLALGVLGWFGRHLLLLLLHRNGG